MVFRIYYKGFFFLFLGIIQFCQYMEEKIFYDQIILELLLASVCHQRYEDHCASFLMASQKKALIVQTVGATLCALKAFSYVKK